MELERLRIGRIAYTTPDQILINHHPLVLFLRKELGVEVEMKLYRTYETIYQNLKRGKLELAWVGTAFYAGLEDIEPIPLVAPLWYGKQSYRGQILVRSDTPIRSISELKGTRMAFVARSSSSGFFFPRLLLRKHGVELNDLDEFAFLEKHDAVVYAVLTKQFDAGATYEGILDLRRFQDQKERFRILETTLKIPNEPILASARLGAKLIKKIRGAFLGAKDAGSLSSLRNLEGFYEVSRSTYQPVREIVKNAE